ncbi:MAG: excinuclease ABC subunit UvrC [Candidatus Odinarchaeum yellowstonii]|uniref:UvrABC system protein C n=1 Tax=Odinarchaeota yellowstonii (strain LCB_4) TaxID=1841599 RepID=A0AAF0D2K5_ODILC|nr:MAG: excinuclease ABC subunit UvrC [Candidatus Odinarchaeum yellowstonii]
MNENILNEIQQLPDKTGVYIFFNKNNECIYIGKAKSILKRVLQHYSSKDVKEKQLMSEVETIKFILTLNEVEALILEQRKISELEPKYNVCFKDDKSYPYIKITSEKYPRMLIVRKLKIGEDPTAEFIGPFSNIEDLKKTFNYLRSFFPLANCKNKIVENSRKRPCLQYNIKRCPGPCFQKIDPEEYSKSVKYMKMFFSGGGAELLTYLENEMKQAASRLEFEKAALMRNRLFAVRRILESRRLRPTGEGAMDFLTLLREYNQALIGVLSVSSEGIANQEYYKFRVSEFNANSEIYEALLTRLYFNTSRTPVKIIVDAADNNLISLLNQLLEFSQKNIKVTYPESNLEEEYLTLLREAALAEFKRNIMKELSDRRQLEDVIKTLAALFPNYNFNNSTLKIEAFDISNIRGAQPVGSRVVFLNGYPFKKGYRMYKIKTVKGQNDYEMLKEVLNRRLKRISSDETPDLIVVDGGRGQLNAALDVLTDHGLNIPVIGLAKEKDEVYTPLSKEPLLFPDDSGFKKTLQYIRDEAHRFAVNYHRKLRSKQLLKSAVDSIPGLSESVKKRIRLAYADLETLLEDSVEEIVKKLQVSYNLAVKIKEHLLNSK